MSQVGRSESKETRCTSRQAQKANDHCAPAGLQPAGWLIIEAILAGEAAVEEGGNLMARWNLVGDPD